MGSIFFQAICRTGIFMICAQAIVHFRPQESYEKYLKLLVSVMVLIQLFLPLGRFLSGAGSKEAVGQLESFRESLEQSMDVARQQAAETEALLQQMTLEEVRRRMEEQNRQKEATQDDLQVQQETEYPSDWSQNDHVGQSLEDQQENDRVQDVSGQQAGGVSVDLHDITVEVGPIERISGD